MSYSLTLEEFLALVTPSTGTRLAAINTGRISGETGRPIWNNYPFASTTALASSIRNLDTQGFTATYFALASFKEGTIDRYRGRKQENVESLRAFWLDLDVGEGNPTKYPSQTAAIVALGAFVKEVGLPRPLVVSSGGGVHAYWPLEADVVVAQWQPVADAFKALTIAHKLRADPTRTADAASVLRPIETTNRKTDPAQPVSVMLWKGTLTKFTSFAELVGTPAPVALVTAIAASPVIFGTAAALPASLAGAMQLSVIELNTPKSAALIFKRCPQMAWAKKHQEQVQEPLWRAGLSILARCTNPREEAVAFSDKYPTFKLKETIDKLESIEDTPYACTKFDELNPGRCKGCQHQGKIKSPIVLGLEYEELPAPAERIVSETVVTTTPEEGMMFGAKVSFEVEEQEVEATSVNPPKPFKRTPAGIVHAVLEPVIDEFGKKSGEIWVDKVIVPFDMYPMFVADSRDSDDEEASLSARWVVKRIGDEGSREELQLSKFEMASADRMRDALFTKTYFNNANMAVMQSVQKYMNAYIGVVPSEQVQRQPVKFGWSKSKAADRSDLEFVVGRSRLSRKIVDGEVTIVNTPIYPIGAMQQYTQFMRPNGSVEGWAQAASGYDTADKSIHVLGILLGLGSPFLKFTGKEGAVVALVGGTGTGKSAVQQMVASAWGSIEDSPFIVSGNSTANGLPKHMITMGNLPVLIDEMRFTTRKEWADFIMIAANGKEKSRARISKTGGGSDVVAAKAGSWCSISIVSTNKDPVDILSSTAEEAEGEFGRLIRLTPRRAQWIPLHEFRDLIRDNCGIIGPALVRCYMQDPDLEIARIRKYESMIVGLVKDVTGFTETTFRLHISAYAVSLWALFHLRKMKAVTWSMSAVAADIITTMKNATKSITSTREWAYSFIVTYYNKNHGNFVHATADAPPEMSPSMLAHLTTSTNGSLPLNAIRGRVETHVGTMILDKRQLSDALILEGRSIEKLLLALTVEGHPAIETKYTLTKGFKNLPVNRTQSIIIENFNESKLETTE